MEETTVLVIVKSADARAAYEEALARTGVAFEVATSFSEVAQMTVEKPYSGLLIDLLTLIRASKEEKAIAYDCINCYPSLRVKWDARRKTLNLTPLEQAFSADTQATLSFFIEGRCKTFHARCMRRHVRKERVINLLLSRSSDAGEAQCLKTFTVNVSEGGAFVHSAEPFAIGERVWLRFLEMPEEPIEAEVRWQLEWGGWRGICGVGLMFRFQSPEQALAVKKMANL
jgi:hypothetical protein